MEKDENKTVLTVDLLKIDDKSKIKLFDGFVTADFEKDRYELLIGGFNGDRIRIKRTIVLSSADIPLSMFLDTK